MNKRKQNWKQQLAVCLMLTFAATYAQGYAPVGIGAQTERQTREILEACLKQQADLDHLTAKVAALEKLDKSNKDLVDALDKQIAAQDRTIKALKAVDATSGKIEVLDAKTEASLQASLADARAQAARYKAEAGFWKKLALAGAPVMLLVGAAVGFILGQK